LETPPSRGSECDGLRGRVLLDSVGNFVRAFATIHALRQTLCLLAAAAVAFSGRVSRT
jgi:hypothetical protein